MEITRTKFQCCFTAGAFDLFHIGHLNLLRRAKELCDYLIVGVNCDELVLEYKHKNPVIPLEERLAIIESIRYVDKVVPLVSRSKLQAYNEYRFDALAVGDDWRGSLHYLEVEKELSKRGVAVVYLPYTQTTSSTLLKNVLLTERIWQSGQG